eukprot:m51a1_g8887 putative serine threonine-protein kinase ht1-like (137) ;mRNA; f:666594-667774
MAPEVFRNEPYTEKVDVYTFALAVAKVFTHQTPFLEMKFDQLKEAVGLKGIRPHLTPSECGGEDEREQQGRDQHEQNDMPPPEPRQEARRPRSSHTRSLLASRGRNDHSPRPAMVSLMPASIEAALQRQAKGSTAD